MSTDMISEEMPAGRLGDGLCIDSGVHVWTFTEVDGGVLVRTEENWTGAQIEADVPPPPLSSELASKAGCAIGIRPIHPATTAARGSEARRTFSGTHG
ncbi:hypothetical protein ACFYT3_26380 [Nocardia amikacinitolerans]|uniref:hypothetical protein n=1 Tax=Nocardia amikacinitolerans TaxID=756689 RepID=UPI00367FB068